MAFVEVKVLLGLGLWLVLGVLLPRSDFELECVVDDFEVVFVSEVEVEVWLEVRLKDCVTLSTR